ncbi:MAG: DUF433 domain-containing protein [Actinomycetota bacterium]|nr:DUF433 domain-containing protein [Actinomycetota bacterium]
MSGRAIGQWARRRLITPSVYAGRRTNLYAFNDVAEAIIVHWLLSEGFAHGQIRAALDVASREYADWPLLRAPLGIGRHHLDDRGLIVLKHKSEYIDVTGRAPGQVVLRPQMLDLARDMLRRGGWIAHELRLESIEVDPLKLGGQPSLRGRRWAVPHVARLGADEEGRAILTDEYGLNPAEVDEASAWLNRAESLV